MDNLIIDKECSIGKNVIIKPGTIIEKGVVIEDDVYIDYGCIIRENVHIKKGTFIGAKSILGEYLYDFYEKRENKAHRLIIGENSIIRTENVIYGDTVIGDNFQSGHKVTIREGVKIGNNVRMGTLTDIQNKCTIGNYVNMHSNVHVSHKTIIKDYVWLFPHVVFTNDPTPPSDELMGVTIESYAVIGARSVLLPGIHIDEDALIGAGAVVNKDVRREKVVVGNPAREICSVRDIKSKFTGKEVYPWKYNFKRGMPWEDSNYMKWYNSLKVEGKND